MTFKELKKLDGTRFEFFLNIGVRPASELLDKVMCSALKETMVGSQLLITDRMLFGYTFIKDENGIWKKTIGDFGFEN